MALLSDEALAKLGKLLLDKTGIVRNLDTTVNLVEEAIAESHTKINKNNDDDSDEGTTVLYGGVVYNLFHLIQKGKFIAELSSDFGDVEKALLHKLCTDDDLTFQVARTDLSGQEWKIAFQVPTVLQNTECKKIQLVCKLSNFSNGNQFGLEAFTLDKEFTSEQASKLLTMYSLQL
jgi:hypothetical protein